MITSIVLAACLVRPLVRRVRYLERSKKPRGQAGRAFLDQMATRPLYPGGLSLRGRDLRGQDLMDAFLADADLSDTDLRGVDLSGANLEGVFLLGARYDAATRWPTDFEPQQHGATRVE